MLMFVDHAYFPEVDQQPGSVVEHRGRRFVTLCCVLWYKILIFIELVKWQGRDVMSRKFEGYFFRYIP